MLRNYQSEYFDKLAVLEAENFWFRARNRLIIWALRHHFAEVGNFLEVGCGTGFVLSGISEAFPHIDLFGSELFSADLAHAASRTPGASFFQMDARAIPYENEFAVMGAFDILEHIENDQLVLEQMFTAVRPGGAGIITVPQHQFMWSQTDEYACHQRRYQAGDLRDKVVKAGFRVELMTSFVSALFPLMLISRLCKKNQHVNNDPLAELKIHKSINFIFEKALALERLLIRQVISFPFGGSLLLIGKKN